MDKHEFLALGAKGNEGNEISISGHDSKATPNPIIRVYSCSSVAIAVLVWTGSRVHVGHESSLTPYQPGRLR